MSYLDPVLPIAPDECPTSYVSRLAVAHFEQSAQEFCTLVGVPFRGIVAGRADAFQALAELTRIPAAELARNAIRTDEAGTTLRGERLLRLNIRRSQVFVCPECLQGDIATSRSPPKQAVYGRIIWRLAAVHTCPMHDVALAEIAHADVTTMYDFAALVAPALANLPRLVADAVRRPAAGLERYVAERLQGTSGRPALLDSLDLFAAIKTCEMFGAAALYSRKHNLKALTPEQWRVCGGKGFDIVRDGEHGIRTFLARMNASYQESRVPNEGPRARFGKLHEWLTAVGQQSSYRPIRDLVRRCVIETMPLGPPTKLFGTVIEERRVHSIRTASLETGMHPMGLRKALEATGIIDAHQRRLRDHRVLFDSGKARPVLKMLKGAISLKEAETYTNAGRVHTKLLLEHGFIEPVLGHAAKKLKTLLFAPAELDGFLDRLLAGAEPVTKAPAGMMGIAKTAKRVNCSAIAIVRGVLDGKIRRRARLDGERGYTALLVDLAEVRQYVRKPAPDGLTLEAVMVEMSTFHGVVRALIDNGNLPTYRAINSVNNAAVRLVARKDLVAFRSKYVQLAELAESAGQHPRAVRAALRRKGIEPAPELPKATYKALFYRRAEVER